MSTKYLRDANGRYLRDASGKLLAVSTNATGGSFQVNHTMTSDEMLLDFLCPYGGDGYYHGILEVNTRQGDVFFYDPDNEVDVELLGGWGNYEVFVQGGYNITFKEINGTQHTLFGTHYELTKMQGYDTTFKGYMTYLGPAIQ